MVVAAQVVLSYSHHYSVLALDRTEMAAAGSEDRVVWQVEKEAVAVGDSQKDYLD